MESPIGRGAGARVDGGAGSASSSGASGGASSSADSADSDSGSAGASTTAVEITLEGRKSAEDVAKDLPQTLEELKKKVVPCAFLKVAAGTRLNTAADGDPKLLELMQDHVFTVMVGKSAMTDAPCFEWLNASADMKGVCVFADTVDGALGVKNATIQLPSMNPLALTSELVDAGVAGKGIEDGIVERACAAGAAAIRAHADAWIFYKWLDVRESIGMLRKERWAQNVRAKETVLGVIHGQWVRTVASRRKVTRDQSRAVGWMRAVNCWDLGGEDDPAHAACGLDALETRIALADATEAAVVEQLSTKLAARLAETAQFQREMEAAENEEVRKNVEDMMAHAQVKVAEAKHNLRTATSVREEMRRARAEKAGTGALAEGMQKLFPGLLAFPKTGKEGVVFGILLTPSMQRAVRTRGAEQQAREEGRDAAWLAAAKADIDGAELWNVIMPIGTLPSAEAFVKLDAVIRASVHRFRVIQMEVGTPLDVNRVTSTNKLRTLSTNDTHALHAAQSSAVDGAMHTLMQRIKEDGKA